MRYLVSHQNEQMGPFSLDEIVVKIHDRSLELLDYLYDEHADDWVLIMEFEPLAGKLRSRKPTGRPGNMGTGTTDGAASEAVPSPVTAHSIVEWFVLKGESRFGPFPFKDLIKMLQQKIVFPFDMVWHAGMPAWARLADLPDFSEVNMRSLFNQVDAKDAFTQRRFPRVKYDGRVLVHDNLSIWKGHGLEISRGGVGISMSNAKVVPGQHLTLHFSSQNGWPAFNAHCEVVSKKYVPDGGLPVEYGLRFLSLTQGAQEEFYKKVA